MALQSQQIVALAAQEAKAPGYTSQAGQKLNLILAELCQDYDLDAAKGTTVFNFNPGKTDTTGLYPNIAKGAGPYALPADFLRMVDEKDAMWFLNNVPYPMKPCDLSQYDTLVQQAGNQAYPYIFATDMSQAPPNGANPWLIVWPPPSGAFQCMIRYRRQMPDIVTPETSQVIPWFPGQQYLTRRLTGELMLITGDDRAEKYLGQADDYLSSMGLVRRYLRMSDDKNDRAQTVKLDRLRFGNRFSTLANTKIVGW